MAKSTIELSEIELRSIILSHGWYTLKPFQANSHPPSITVAYSLPTSSGVLTINGGKSKCFSEITSSNKKEGRLILSNILSLDISKPLHNEKVCNTKKWNWIKERKLGRMLRSPTLFEDCFKAICATNTTWKRTVGMVASTIAKYGENIGETKAFPLPKILLRINEKDLKTNTSCGFRARYFKHLCKIASQNEDIFLYDGWKSLSSSAFLTLLNQIKGIGPVSVGYISRLYGKPCGYAIDSYVIRRCRDLWKISRSEIEQFAIKRYKRFGEQSPLAFWFELTKHWYDVEVDSSNEEF
ncbi:hypothetical protein ACFL54_07010 [Planctomycetota bacterium]